MPSADPRQTVTNVDSLSHLLLNTLYPSLQGCILATGPGSLMKLLIISLWCQVCLHRSLALETIDLYAELEEQMVGSTLRRKFIKE